MEKFKTLRWYKLPVTFKNIRLINSSRALPLEVIQAIIKGVTISVEGFYEPEASPVFFHIKEKGYKFKLHEFAEIPVEVIFCRKDVEYIRKWQDALKSYIADPSCGKNFDIISLGEIEERFYDKLADEFGRLNTDGEICLEFLTPFPFKPQKGKPRIYISTDVFIGSYEKRFSRLFGINLTYQSTSDNLSILPYYWKYTEIKHPSISQQGTTQYINGCIGKFYIKGVCKDLLPFLILGSELHTGNKLSNSCGYYFIHNESPAYFDKFFPDKKAIIPVIQDILQRYDNAAESLSLIEKRQFNETEFAENLQKEIKEGSYTPAPNIAFLIKKKNSADRLVEQLNYKDLIFQQYLKKTIEDVFERTFEEESIGFRKGVSREKAIEMVRAGIAEGYQYVIESDIDDFFPSVDLKILTGLLEHYLPQKDLCVKDSLYKSIRNGYILNGVYHERTRGLAQGSPLSPLLANFYLDSFDEEIKKLDVGIIRYADDFIILARSKEEALEILSKSEAFLFGLGIRIKKEKTSIKHIKEGFQFLGIRFERSEVRIEPEDEFKRLKKPLYITEPYLFLSLNGEAIDIKKNGAVIETIPIRRLSEIMVMDKAVFSTALIAKCTNSNIPISVTLNSGYYINTIKPDSKLYYDISFQHGKRYYSLSDTEVLCIAKEFAAGKINNYISLFRQRYVKEQNLFVRELEEAIMQIQEAGDINYVRGIEGSTAKKIYHELNTIIDDESFRIKKRDRKNPDRINSLLNYGYYLLFSRINATVRTVGLNPYLGFLHSPLDNYESFVSDIVELFRARIDRFIIRLLNLKSITKEHFLETEKGMFLKKDAVKRFLNHFEAEMERKKGESSTRQAALSLKEEVYLQVSVFKKWVLENGSLSFYKWQGQGGQP